MESLLQTLCEDTEIAEMDLQMGSFSMKVRRSLTGSLRGGAAATNSAAPASPQASPIATQSLDMVSILVR